MDIITGFVGKKHITSEQDRDINIGIFGEKSYVLRTGAMMELEISSNNEVKIRDGVIMHQGCAASIKKNTYDSLTIVNGSQGMKRIDLIVARYERNQDTEVESMSLVVLQGTPVEANPTAPEYVQGDIQAGDTVADMPMYEIVLDGLNIVETRKVFESAPDFESLNSNIESALGYYTDRLNTFSGNYLIKRAGVVYANINVGTTKELAATHMIATIPEGFRPIKGITTQFSGNAYAMTIATNGNIQAATAIPENATLRKTISWIAG